MPWMMIVSRLGCPGTAKIRATTSTRSVLFDLKKGFVLDAAGNINVKANNITAIEFADIINPVVTSALLNYQNGVFNFNASETLDSTPYSQINYTKIIISNTSNVGSVGVSLAGTTSADIDTTNVIGTIPEPTRAVTIPFSGTRGGDSSAFQTSKFDNEYFK